MRAYSGLTTGSRRKFWEQNRYQAYEGLTMPGYPNFYIMLGPYALTGSSYLKMVEANAIHLARCIEAARERDATLVEVRQDVHDRYFVDIQRRQQGTVFLNHNCGASNSYYFDRPEERIEYTILVPAMLNMIVKLPNVDQLDLSSVRTITTGSAPPSAWSLQEFKRRWDIDIVNIWGQNEGTCLVAGPADVPDLEMRVDHLPWWGKEGVQWPSGAHAIEVKILGDENEEITEPGGIGELCYRSPGVFAGYFRRPDITERSFTADGFFRTGDLFIVQDDKHLGFYDRKKDMVIRGGFNISSVEVENAVLGFDKVQDVAVIPQPDDIMGERVCICVVPADEDAPPTLEEINDYLKAQGMSVYKLPEKMKLIEAIPRNPVGKILKKELRAL
jgi:acyl-CoA synthetase (AMP-forming)/AMP-acid ligase II